jgi:hypothetical protein
MAVNTITSLVTSEICKQIAFPQYGSRVVTLFQPSIFYRILGLNMQQTMPKMGKECLFLFPKVFRGNFQKPGPKEKLLIHSLIQRFLYVSFRELIP